MRNYNNYELVDKDKCYGFKNGDLFRWIDQKIEQHFVIGEIIKPIGFDIKGIAEYYPEFTPVANASMFHINMVEVVEIKIINGKEVKILKPKE